ncbi:MAG: putative sugar nucleotidyl transferase [Balneolaceae bacterium]
MTRPQKETLCFFEDTLYHPFKPLVLTRPLDDLRTGIYTVREKWLADLDRTNACRKVRPELKGLYEDEHPDEGSVLWINSRLLPGPQIIDHIHHLKAGEGLLQKGLVLAIRTNCKTTAHWLRPESIVLSPHENPSGDLSASRPKGIEFLEIHEPVRMLKELWDLLAFNSAEMIQDIQRTPGLRTLDSDPSRGIWISGEHPVYAAADVHLEPGVTFVTEAGPIFLGNETRIMSGSILRGPTAIGEHSTVRMGAKLYEGTSIGPICKVGGELANVIFHSYSNKAHDGFAGNSIIGQWCNLGADTNTSNLKNNYSTVRFINWHTRHAQETGEQFLGTIMGDHTKTGINSMLATGTNCGVCCNLFTHGFPPKLIPSFSWVDSSKVVVYDFDRAVDTMERVMKRRDVPLTPAYIELMRTIFEKRTAS